MDDEHISRSPPSDDYKLSPKRQKMKTIDSTKLTPSNNNSVSQKNWNDQKGELAAIRRSILGRRLMLCQLQDIRVRIGQIIKEEEQNLDKYVDEDRAMLKKLTLTLGKSMGSTEEDSSITQDAQTFVETEMPQIKRRLSIRIRKLAENLDTDNSSREDPSTHPNAQGNEREGELPSTKEAIPTLHETTTENLVLEDQIVNVPKKLIDTYKYEQLVMVHPWKLNGSTVTISSSFRHGGLSDRGVPSVAATKKGSTPQLVQCISRQGNGQSNANESNAPLDLTVNRESAPGVSNEVDSPPCSQVNDENQDPTAVHPRRDYYVLPPDSRFSEVDWMTQYKRDGSVYLQPLDEKENRST